MKREQENEGLIEGRIVAKRYARMEERSKPEKEGKKERGKAEN